MNIKRYLSSFVVFSLCLLNLYGELSITKLNKTSGGTTGFSSIAVFGSGFSKTAQVYFGDQRVILDRWVRDDLIYILTTKFENEGTVDVKVIQDGEEVVLLDAYTFINKAPVLNSISRTEGLSEGGLRVTLKGVQLTANAEIEFDEDKVNRFIFLHDRRAIVYSPPAEVGVKDFIYTNEFGSDVIEDGFEYLSDSDERAQPQITSLNRTDILQSGNARILVRGKNFSSIGQWNVGNLPAERVIHRDSENAYIYTPPIDAEGLVSISYVGNSGEIELTDALEIVANKPHLTNLIPNKGFTENETLIKLQGKYFTDNLQVFVGEDEANFFRFDHEGQVLYKVQPQTQGVVNLRLVTSFGELLLPDAFEFADNLPRIDYLWPSTGPIDGATKVVVRGNHFGLDELTVELNGTIQPIIAHKDTRSFSFMSEPVPQKISSGLTVTTGDGIATRDNAFLYDTQRPVIDFIRPLTGPSNGNKYIDIYGLNLTSSTNVELGGVVYPIHRFYNSSQIRIKTQATEAGVVDLVLNNANGQDEYRSCYTFSDDSTVNAGEPIVSWIKNSRSPLTGRTPVYVRGKNYGDELVILLNGVEIDYWRHPRLDHIRFYTPQVNASVNYDLVLRNEFGELALTDAIQYVEEEPVFYSIKENDGYVHGDTFFTVYGRFFTPFTELLIEGVPAKPHRFHHSQAMTFQSVGGSLGTQDLDINTEFGNINLADAWNYKAIPPAVIRVNPNIGELEGGNWVRVYGKYFSPDSVVLINGIESTNVKVLNTKVLKVLVPDNSTNEFGLVDIQVETAYGVTSLEKGYYFKPSGVVNAAPVITSTAKTNAIEAVEYNYEVTVLDPDDSNNGVDLTWGLTNAPAGMNISSTGVITWRPTEGVLSSGEFTISVIDGGENGSVGDSQTLTVTVAPVNNGPTITSNASSTATEDVLYTYSTQVVDQDDLNDGVNLIWSLLNAPAGMSVSNTGVVSWVPTEGQLTSGQVTLVVRDGQENFAEEAEEVFEITVTPVNDAPSITSSALLSATEDVSYSYSVQVTDTDSSSFTYSLSFAPTGMSVSNLGVITWTPSEGVLTSGLVSVIVSDGDKTVIQSFTVTVTPVNDAPEITTVAPVVATEDIEYVYNASATDAESDALAWSLVSGPEGMIVNESGVVTWTPLEGVVGVVPAVLSVSDRELTDTEALNITVTPVNDAPEITSIAVLVATEDIEYQYQVIVTDVDSTEFTYELSGAPAGMVISDSGLVTWTPVEDILTSGLVTLSVSDESETVDQQFTVAVAPVNDAPEITSVAVLVATEDVEYQYQVTVTDVDSTEFTYELSGTPVGMIVSESGLVTWTPVEGVLTSGVVTLSVSDESETVSETLTIVVNKANRAPVITSTAPTTATEDIEYLYQVVATDPDGDELNYSLSGAPDGMVVSSAGNVTWTPTLADVGSHTITLIVSDGEDSVSEVFTVVVSHAESDFIAITSPGDGYEVQTGDVSISGVVKAGIEVDVYLNDVVYDSEINYHVNKISSSDNGFWQSGTMSNLILTQAGNSINLELDRENSGASAYHESVELSSSFQLRGTPQNWHGEYEMFEYDLDFDFPFYENIHNKIYVDTKGRIAFPYLDDFFWEIKEFYDPTADPADYMYIPESYGPDDSEMSYVPVIAPFWDDLTTDFEDADIYIYEGQGFIEVTWDAFSVWDETRVQFSAVLHESGKIEFKYGQIEYIDSYPYIGISSGNGYDQILRTSINEVSITAPQNDIVISNETPVYSQGQFISDIYPINPHYIYPSKVNVSIKEQTELKVLYRFSEDLNTFTQWQESYEPNIDNVSYVQFKYEFSTLTNASPVLIEHEYVFSTDSSDVIFEIQSIDINLPQNIITTKVKTLEEYDSVSIILFHNAPVAKDDSYTFNEDESQIFDVTKDDEDDYNRLILLSVQSVSNQGGQVTLEDGNVHYQPPSNYNGLDSFTYTISDGQYTDSANVVLSIDQVNDEPFITTATNLIVYEDSGLHEIEDFFEGIFVGGGVDEEDQEVLVDLSIENQSLFSIQPFIKDIKDLSFELESDQYGLTEFEITLSDDGVPAESKTYTFSINVININDPPNVVNDFGETQEDIPLLIQALYNDKDDGPFELYSFDGTTVNNGNVTLDGPYFLYRPAPSFHGQDIINYSVKDDHNEMVSGNVLITIHSVEDQFVTNFDKVDVLANSNLLIDVLENDISDYLIEISDYSGNTTKGANIVLINNSLLYTPEIDYIGSDNFYYTAASNGQELEGYVEINVYTNNQAPLAISDNININESGVGFVNVLANDSDAEGDAFHLMEITESELVDISFSANGQVVITGINKLYGSQVLEYTVADKFNSATGNLFIEVNAVNQAPIGRDQSAITYENTRLTLFTLLVNDSVDNYATNTKSIIIEDYDNEDVNVVLSSNVTANNGIASFDGSKIIYQPPLDFIGNDSVKYTLVDEDGNSSSEYSLNITILDTSEATEPIVNLSLGFENGYVNSLYPIISGNLILSASIDSSLSYVKLNGEELIDVVWTNSSFYAQPFTNLIDGMTYSLEIKVVDQLGRSEYEQISFTVDVTPPQLSLSVNDFKEAYNTLPITLSQSHSDVISGVGSKAKAYLNGALFSSQLRSSYQIDKAELGLNVFTTVVPDEAGNYSSESVTFFYDNVAPVITIDSPTDGEVLLSRNVYINGHVEDVSEIRSAYVKIGERLYGLVEDGHSFYGSITIDSDDETSDLQVFVSDLAGNETLESFAVEFSEETEEYYSFAERTTASNTFLKRGFLPLEDIGYYLYEKDQMRYDFTHSLSRNTGKYASETTGNYIYSSSSTYIDVWSEVDEFTFEEGFDVSQYRSARRNLKTTGLSSTSLAPFSSSSIVTNNSTWNTSGNKVFYQNDYYAKRIDDGKVTISESSSNLLQSHSRSFSFFNNRDLGNGNVTSFSLSGSDSEITKELSDSYDYKDEESGYYLNSTTSFHETKSVHLSGKFSMDDVASMVPKDTYPEFSQGSIYGMGTTNYRKVNRYKDSTHSSYEGLGSNYYTGSHKRSKYRFGTKFEKNQPYRISWKERKKIYSHDMNNILSDTVTPKYYPETGYKKGSGTEEISKEFEIDITKGFEEVITYYYRLEQPYIFIQNTSNRRNIVPVSDKDHVYEIKGIKSVIIYPYIDNDKYYDRPTKYVILESPEGWSVNQEGHIFSSDTAHSGLIKIRVKDFELESAYYDIGFEAESCNSCTSTCAYDPKLRSAYLNMNLGDDVFGREVGQLIIHENKITEESFDMKALKIVDFNDNLEIEEAEGAMSITSYNKHIQIFNTDLGYTVNIFNNIGDGKISQEYPELLLQSWRIEKVESFDGIDYLKMVLSKDGDETVFLYGHDAVNNIWTLDDGNQKEELKFVYDSSTNTTIRFRSIFDESGTMISHNCQRFCEEDSTNLKLDSIDDPFGIHRKTLYEYDQDESSSSYKKLTFKQTPDNGWVKYIYSNEGLLEKEVHQEMNNSRDTLDEDNLSITYEYTPHSLEDDGSRSGLARTVTTRFKGALKNVLYRILKVGEIKEIISKDLGLSVFDPSNEITVKRYYVDGPYKGDVKEIVNPEGIVTKYEHVIDSEFITDFVISGEMIDGAFVSGTNSMVIKQLDGTVLSKKVIDIENDLTVSSIINSDFDEHKRPLRIDYLDETFEEFVYSCCGLESKTERDGSVTSWTRYDDGSVESETRNGITKFYYRDALGRVIEESVFDKNGVESTVSQISFNLAGEVISRTNSKSETTSYEKSKCSMGFNMSTTTYHDGSTSITRSYCDGKLYQTTGSRNITKTYEYGFNSDGTQWTKEYIGLIGDSEWIKTTKNSQGQLVSTEKANGAIATNHYNTKGELERAVDFDGKTTLYSYHENGDSEYVAVDINQNGIIDLAGPDQVSQSKSVADITNYNDETVYRTKSYRWFEGSSADNLISTSYRSLDGRRSWTEANGLVSSSVTTIDAADVTKTVVSTSPLGLVSTQSYSDGLLDTQESRDAGGNLLSSMSYGYDELNRVSSQSDHTGRVTTFGYEGVTRERVSTTVTGGELSQVTSVSEEADNVTVSTLADGTQVFTQKNIQGQIVKRWGSRVYPVEYTYEKGRIDTMTTWQNFNTSEGAAVTSWHYDNVGNLTSKVDDQGNATVYTYTAGGKLETRTWARGIVTTYEYDTAGRLEQTSFLDGTESISLTYDRLGRKTSVTDASGTRSFIYSPIGQLVTESYTSGLFAGFTFGQTTDEFGRRNSFTLNDGLDDIYSTTFGFDSAGRLNQFVHREHEAKYDFHQNGQVDGLVLKNDGTDVVSTNKSFDALGRLESVHHSDFSSTVQSFAYDLNDANQRTKVTEADGSYWVYTYDSLGQLSSGQKYTDSDVAIEGLNFGYEFDDIGSRTSSTINNQTASYTANSLNQYEQREVPGVVDVVGKSAASDVTVSDLVTVRTEEYYTSQVALDNSVTIPYALVINEGGVLSKTEEGYLRSSPELMSYDVDGNLEADGLWNYYWNGENRLTRMGHKFEGLVLEFSYDSQGRRFRKRVLRDGILDYERRYLYSGYNCIAELDELNAFVKTYLWGLDLSGSEQGAGGVGGLLAVTDEVAGSTSYVLSDANGNATGAVDASDGSLVYSCEYSPFGKVLVESGASVSDYGFSTKPLDRETGLNYYNYRYYSADLGRWLNRDPLEEKGNLNLYLFTRNDNINLIDVDGRAWGWGFAFVGAAIGGAANGSIQVIYNVYKGEPPTKNLGSAIASGATSGFIAGGLAAGDITAVGAGLTLRAGLGIALKAGAASGLAGTTVSVLTDEKDHTLGQGLQEIAVGTTISTLTAGVSSKVQLRKFAQIIVERKDQITNIKIKTHFEFITSKCPVISDKLDEILTKELAQIEKINEMATRAASRVLYGSIVGETANNTILFSESIELNDTIEW